MSRFPSILLFFFFNDTATTEIYTLSLHDALPILPRQPPRRVRRGLLHARHRLVQQGRERDAPRAPRHRAAARRVSQGQARLLAPLQTEEAARGDARIRPADPRRRHHREQSEEIRPRVGTRKRTPMQSYLRAALPLAALAIAGCHVRP